MGLILWDFECPKCGQFPGLVNSGETKTECKCGRTAHRVFTPPGCNTSNQNAAWIRTVLGVVDKDSKEPHVVEFRKNPTRSNYEAWMKGEGIRPAAISISQHGEEYEARRNKKEREKSYSKEMVESVMKERMRRKRIELY